MKSRVAGSFTWLLILKFRHAQCQSVPQEKLSVVSTARFMYKASSSQQQNVGASNARNGNRGKYQEPEDDGEHLLPYSVKLEAWWF